jgi:hypothetical protein
MELFKKTSLRFLKDVLFVGDRGYQGLAACHFNSLTPYKKPTWERFD